MTLWERTQRTLLASNEESPVQKQVLDAARRLTNNGKKPFTLPEIVAALPVLNEGTVRTHVSSRCCVNAPDNHQHRWPYFYRVRRGLYRLRAPFASPPPDGLSSAQLRNRRPLPSSWRPPALRDSQPDAGR